MVLGPNNDFLRLDKKNKLLKYLLDILKNVKDNINHGQTRSTLINNAINEKFQEEKNTFHLLI
ncbi:hypothetical protein ALNOE001_09840 [Candidatus Methanobinarius endosymbioticus]|uniref:Uncharacterized protein n=1 Tax=Candidatus Methanobinarius endosymbioticus TaxID=2006182 RepID=A0A366MC53_9EURY|nr:hypothetical protein ALNOE001_09840 [Candidatus Methanobinarius endosymbioticus]